MLSRSTPHPPDALTPAPKKPPRRARHAAAKTRATSLPRPLFLRLAGTLQHPQAHKELARLLDLPPRERAQIIRLQRPPHQIDGIGPRPARVLGHLHRGPQRDLRRLAQPLGTQL